MRGDSGAADRFQLYVKSASSQQGFDRTASTAADVVVYMMPPPPPPPIPHLHLRYVPIHISAVSMEACPMLSSTMVSCPMMSREWFKQNVEELVNK